MPGQNLLEDASLIVDKCPKAKILDNPGSLEENRNRPELTHISTSTSNEQLQQAMSHSVQF